MDKQKKARFPFIQKLPPTFPPPHPESLNHAQIAPCVKPTRFRNIVLRCGNEI